MDSIEECWAMAHEWVDKGLTERELALGGVGVAGGCFTNKRETAI